MGLVPQLLVAAAHVKAMTFKQKTSPGKEAVTRILWNTRRMVLPAALHTAAKKWTTSHKQPVLQQLCSSISSHAADKSTAQPRSLYHCVICSQYKQQAIYENQQQPCMLITTFSSV